MTSIDTSSAPARTPAAEQLVEEFGSLMRVLHLYKAQSAMRSAHSLLFPVALHGPLRTTALAELVHADPSTTSRQVAELVAEGLVERQDDPADRRACLLAATAAGRATVSAMRAQRAQLLAQALSDWAPEEITAFTADLRRFREALAASALPSLPTPQTPQEQ
ncbi:transcriptional regulator, MarR family [Quadrisphaera granulorum]|uniref:MarR family transcriptional regulator n=1 Tax=Quadrisphaera granulorum TaxID=317664 RepID=A0A316AEM3_9ACTN|nr:MarR family transcriptional regulator [Quadrisphaera granulorum]PWJ55430.1 MarR family transcriptional regulator [Quadrisphaera granulorum]SZE95494.1 transcriptional regulator, MarR family [Quadrisphaera granulorum]